MELDGHCVETDQIPSICINKRSTFETKQRAIL